MKFLTNKWGKFLVLVPVLFLALNAFYFMHASKEIQNALLREKYDETINFVEMLSSAVEANTERVWSDHEQNIINSVEYADKLYQIYAGAYKLVDDNLILINECFYETSPFEPFDFVEFTDAAMTQESGSLIIGYTPENQKYRELNLYFKWMPLYSPPNERYLVIAGVSKYSVTSAVPLWVSMGQLVNMGVTFIINTWLILLLVRLGYIYEDRKGEKWRKRGGYHV